MYLSLKWFGSPFSGLFSPEYLNAPWSMDKLFDALKHMWIPVIVVGTAGTASQIRIMRATMMDELHKPYVDTALSKGLPMHKVILKYPVRHAVTPLASTIGWMLPGTGIRQRNRCHCAEFADHRSLSSGGTQKSGYVPGWHLSDDAGSADNYWHSDIRHSACFAGPTHTIFMNIPS